MRISSSRTGRRCHFAAWRFSNLNAKPLSGKEYRARLFSRRPRRLGLFLAPGAIAVSAIAIIAPWTPTVVVEAGAIPRGAIFLGHDRLRLDGGHLILVQMRRIGHHHAQDIFAKIDIALDRRHRRGWR